MATLIRRFLFLVFLAGAVSAAAYVRSDSFSRKWCAFVEEQCAKRNIHLSLQRLTLDPFEGLVARGIKVYNDQEHREMLGELDRLNLDFDFSKMLRNELFIEGMDLRNADVSVPLDLEDPTSETIKLTEMNARLLFVGDRVEIRKAEGTLYGLRMNVTGSLLRSRKDGQLETEEQKEERRRKRIAALHARRNLIVEVARGLRHFESAKAPRLDVEINGDIDEPEKMTVSMQLSASNLQHGNYVCEELSAVGTYAGETVDISRIHVRDHLGEVEAGATWQLGDQHVDFQIHSTADLPSFLATLLQSEKIREVVFYEPVDVNLEGRYLLGKALPEDAFLPVECVGSIKAGRFTTRGKVLEGMSVELGLSAEGCYFREGVLRHKSGTLGFQGMWHKKEGLKYQVLMQLDPDLFIPFIAHQKAREMVQRFKFYEHSGIYLEIKGESPDLNMQNCHSTARVDLRHFEYRGVAADHGSCEFELAGPLLTFRNIMLERKEGGASAKEIAVNLRENRVRFVEILGQVYPVEIVSCFAPKIADIIAKYRLTGTPRVSMNGDLYYKGPGTDLKIIFDSAGTGTYNLWSKDYLVDHPRGELRFEGGGLIFNVAGKVFETSMQCQGALQLKMPVKDYVVKFRSGLFPYEVFGKNVPFEQVLADVECQEGISKFSVKSKVFDGAYSLKGEVNTNVSPMVYRGEMRLSAISFKRFASVYSPGNDTLGDITGHFNFSGAMGDWKALKGEGALTILNSNLYAVPILGPLTPLLGAMLPRPIKGYNEAKEADCTFVVENGFATTENIEALTAVFRLVCKGSVDFLENRIQFDAQAKFRGLPGLVLFPVSEILEYVAEGSVGEPLWRPRYFSISKEKEGFRKPNESPNTPSASTSPSAPDRATRSGSSGSRNDRSPRSSPRTGKQ